MFCDPFQNDACAHACSACSSVPRAFKILCYVMIRGAIRLTRLMPCAQVQRCGAKDGAVRCARARTVRGAARQTAQGEI